MRDCKFLKKTIQIRRIANRNKKNNKIKKLYDLLYLAFGPQGWWPITTKKGQEPVYRKKIYGPDNLKQAFEISAGAILTQNTSWNNVKICIKNLSSKNWLNPKKILHCKKEELGSVIKSSGYYRQKAIKLKNFSKWWLKRISKINELKINELRQELLSINGIGPETADSILLYAFGKLSFVIDAYTRRIYERITGKKENNYHILKEIFEKSIPKSIEIYNEYHALLVELAKRNCKKKKSICQDCPCAKLCEYNKNKQPYIGGTRYGNN